jgi:hypothetical protein
MFHQVRGPGAIRSSAADGQRVLLASTRSRSVQSGGKLQDLPPIGPARSRSTCAFISVISRKEPAYVGNASELSHSNSPASTVSSASRRMRLNHTIVSYH